MFKKDSQQSTIDNYSLLSNSVNADMLSHDDLNIETKKIELEGLLDLLKQKLQTEKTLNQNNKLQMLNKKLETLSVIKNKNEDCMIQLEQKNTQCCYKEYVLNFIEKEETEISNWMIKNRRKLCKKNQNLFKFTKKNIQL